MAAATTLYRTVKVVEKGSLLTPQRGFGYNGGKSGNTTQYKNIQHCDIQLPGTYALDTNTTNMWVMHLGIFESQHKNMFALYPLFESDVLYHFHTR